MIRDIVQLSLDATILRARAISVKRVGAVQGVIRDLKDTWPTQAALGIAAPQIGVGLRLFAFRRNDDVDQPPEVLINPKVVRIGGLADDTEGCLSVSGLYARCPRAEFIEITAMDESFRRVRYRLEGYDARIIQHEMDHLDGVLYIDRIADWGSVYQWDRRESVDGFEWVAATPPQNVLAALKQYVRSVPQVGLKW